MITHTVIDEISGEEITLQGVRPYNQDTFHSNYILAIVQIGDHVDLWEIMGVSAIGELTKTYSKPFQYRLAHAENCLNDTSFLYPHTSNPEKQDAIEALSNFLNIGGYLP